MATLERRVDKLEAGGGAGGPRCPECGGLDDHGPNDTYEIVFVAPEEAGQNEWCPECGRQTNIVIEWGDEQSPPEGF
jgi:hypothetical protein